jgi:uncharacterized protein (DUF1697 family)
MALAEKMGKPISVMVRKAAELKAVLEGNPYDGREPSKTLVVFLAEAPAKDVVKNVVAPGGEEISVGKRELYIYYPDGMGKSKLKLPAAVTKGTARNINTVGKLVEMAAAI